MKGSLLIGLMFLSLNGFAARRRGDVVINTLLPVKHIAVSINRSPQEVYDFASKPENLPKWASGLGGNIEQVKGEWFANAPAGRIKIQMSPKNPYGVLDHDVLIVEKGVRVHVPMRVIPNGRGSEVIFSLIRQPEMPDDQFAQDTQFVEKDLNTLKELLEK